MLRRICSLLLTVLMLVAPSLAPAWPGADQQPGAACQAPVQTTACHCQARADQEAASPCACGADAPCQVSAAPAAPHLEALTSQAWQPPLLGLAWAADSADRPSWAHLARPGGRSPWRPPKPLYLRHLAFLI